MSLQDAINTGARALDWTDVRFKNLNIDENFNVDGNVIIAGDISADNANFSGTATINDVDATNINTATFSTTGTSNFNGDVNFLAGNSFDNQMNSTYSGVSNFNGVTIFNDNVNFTPSGYLDAPVFSGGLIIGNHPANPSYLFYGYERKSHTVAAGAQTGCTVNGAAYSVHMERIGNIVNVSLVAGVASNLTKNGTNSTFTLTFNSAALFDLYAQVPGNINCGTCSFDAPIGGLSINTAVCIDVTAPEQVAIQFISDVVIPDATIFHNTGFSHTFSVYAPLPAPTP